MKPFTIKKSFIVFSLMKDIYLNVNIEKDTFGTYEEL